MSNGALAQLTSYGAQDVYLSGNPQITFFKSVYKRHTNFAMQDVLVSTTSTFLSQTQDTKLTFKVARNGDLLGKCWFEVFLPNTTGGAASTFTNWRNNTGHGLIKEITLRIGGQEIDKQDGYYLDIINELDPDGEEEHLGLNKHTSYVYVNNNHGNTNNCPPLRLFIPLKFWFNLNVGSALPLVALQYHEVEFDVVFRKLDELIVSNVAKPAITLAGNATVELWGTYIDLDTQERTKFAQNTHEYLITKVNKKQITLNNSTDLDISEFNMPTKELFFVFTDSNQTLNCKNNICNPRLFTPGSFNIDNNNTMSLTSATPAGVNANDLFNYQYSKDLNAAAMPSVNAFVRDSGMLTYNSGAIENFEKFTLVINGHDRFAEKEASYFRLYTPVTAGYKVPSKHIYYYSFSLKGYEDDMTLQPTGSCNFSRLDTKIMRFSNNNGNISSFFGNGVRQIRVFTVCYNILRIASGLGGLAFSN